MDFSESERVGELKGQLRRFLDEHVVPAEARYHAEFDPSNIPHRISPVMEELKDEAKRRGLWNLFLPHEHGAGLSNLEYAPLAELSGHSAIAPEAMNCSAPDTGNMEVLALAGTAAQKQQWLQPLLDGEIRSCIAMTEPDVASSDPTNITTRFERDGTDWVINGRKWWISGAAHPLCRVLLVMGVSDPSAQPYARHSFVLVPIDSPGVRIVRQLTVFGYDDPGAHCEVIFDGVRVPSSNLLGEAGGAFSLALHHCMRAIGMAERALGLMVTRAQERVAFGKPLARQGVVREQIARSRIEIEQARLLCLKAAWLLDTTDNRSARTEIASIKVVAPQMACNVIDRAIQIHGGAGLSQDLPLAQMAAWARALRILDGPDEVHLRSIARHEFARKA